jgi:hypothetical protein
LGQAGQEALLVLAIVLLHLVQTQFFSLILLLAVVAVLVMCREAGQALSV